jgi:hypothetical protein
MSTIISNIILFMSNIILIMSIIVPSIVKYYSHFVKYFSYYVTYYSNLVNRVPTHFIHLHHFYGFCIFYYSDRAWYLFSLSFYTWGLFTSSFLFVRLDIVPEWICHWVAMIGVMVKVMIFNAIFNNISEISWRSDLLVDETGIPKENHRPATSYWQTWSRNAESSTPRYERDSNSQR